MVAEGKPIKAIAAAQGSPPEAVDAEVEAVFVEAGRRGVGAGRQGACTDCASSTRPSSTGRNRARRCPASCPGAWPRSCAATAGASARPSEWWSPC